MSLHPTHDAAGLARAIRDGEVLPTEVVDDPRAIHDRNDRTNAFVTVWTIWPARDGRRGRTRDRRWRAARAAFSRRPRRDQDLDDVEGSPDNLRLLLFEDRVAESGFAVRRPAPGRRARSWSEDEHARVLSERRPTASPGRPEHRSIPTASRWLLRRGRRGAPRRALVR